MKHYILTKRHVHIFIVIFILLIGLVVLIATNNVSTTNANRNLEKKLGAAQSKAQRFEQKYKDLIESGTCLDRKPKYEEVIG